QSMSGTGRRTRSRRKMPAGAWCFLFRAASISWEPNRAICRGAVMRLAPLALAIACLPILAVPARAIDNAALIDDEQTCQAAALGVNGPHLLDYFRTRTPDAAQRQRLARLVADLDAPAFQTRHLAAQKLVEIGPPALPFLRQTLSGNSLEMTRRGE